MSTKQKLDFDQDLSIDRLIEDYSKDPDNARQLREAEIRLELSEYMKALRESCNLTQTELARIVGKTQPLIAKLEAGAYDRMGFSGIRTYARAMGIDFVSINQMFKPIAEQTTEHFVEFGALLHVDGADDLIKWTFHGDLLSAVYTDEDSAQNLVAA
jgi:transcriptional regulator with XRE-family HTH domain